MDNNELYVLLLEHLIKTSGNEPLIDLAKICKTAPDIASKYLDVPLAELKIQKEIEMLGFDNPLIKKPKITKQLLLDQLPYKKYFYIKSGNHWILCLKVVPILTKVEPAIPTHGKKYFPIANLSLQTLLTLPGHTICSLTEEQDKFFPGR